jgi:flagellar basal body-associated protein FliL
MNGKAWIATMIIIVIIGVGIIAFFMRQAKKNDNDKKPPEV